MVAAARERGIPVLGELEIGWRLLANEFIAVTGSNGKTTTVELIGHIHREAGAAGRRSPATSARRCTSLPGHARRRDDDRRLRGVRRSSSRTREAFAPEAAVLLNLTEDHLDRHGTFEAYRAAKLRDLRPPAATRRSRSRRSASASRTSAAARAASCFGAGPGARARRDRAGQLWWDEQPLLARRGARPARRPQRAERDGGRRGGLARGVDAEAVRAGCRAAARERGMPVVGELEIGWRLLGDTSSSRSPAPTARRRRSS